MDEAKGLQPGAFYQTRHQLIFKAMLALKAKGDKVDLVTVYSQLLETGELKKVGDHNALGKIAEYAISINPASHAEIIKSCALKRDLASLGSRLTHGALNGSSVDELLAMVQEKTSALSQSTKSKFQLTPISKLELKPPDWLIYSILERDTLSQWIGDPGSGKTFVGGDLACCIATGTDFHGLKVSIGPVVYIAGEGQNGLQRRFRAWQIRHQVSLESTPLFVSTAPASFCDPASISIVQAAIDGTEEKPAAIFVDTLARNFGSGDENSTQDMTAFVASMDEIRAKYRCAIILIHHSGHGDKSRGRGSTALKGALDTEYRLEKDDTGTVRMSNTKMKDFEPPAPMAFKIRSVELGIKDKYGQEIIGGILDGIEYKSPAKTPAKKQGKWQAICQGILMDLFEEHRRNLEKGNFDPNDAKVLISDVRERAVLQGLNPKNWHRYLNDLKKLNNIKVNQPYFELTPQITSNHLNPPIGGEV
ncbi:helicase RepA family protein [Desulfobacter curvatus]|uniref:helicase RepA family protein n=1 Tax=Desulfobacter curvatus TaxID=2290 RepID=UPI000362143C|nr:helicase RepA family protein [Desulfobacter curvatus]